MAKHNNFLTELGHAPRLLALLLLCCTALSLHAYSFEVGGIYYNITSTDEVSVTYKSYSNGGYGGVVHIPEEVVYNGTTYRVTKIGNEAFYGCTGLTQVTIPNSVTSIDGRAFDGCTGLTQVTIPNSVTSIGGGAFYFCTGLTKLTIGNSVTSIGFYAFRGCTSLTELTIPNSVTSIGWYAFYECTGLTKLTIPNSVTSIGYGAFAGCKGLTELTIGNSVTEIGYMAFNGCTSLASIISLNTTPPKIETSTFDADTEKNATLHVPDGCKSIYGQTQFWENFFYIQADAVDGIERVSADMEQEGEQGGKAVIYTLNGVKLSTTDPSTLPKGIYIINGKKTAIK